MRRFVVFTLILGIAWSVAGPGMGQEGQPDADLTELVAEMADLLDRALYLAIAALSWPDRDDLTLYIQGVINLLEGPNSPAYDDAGGATTPDGDGLMDLYLAVQTAGLTTTEAEPISLRPSQVVQVAQAMEHMERYLFMAAAAAKNAVDRVYSVTGGQEELRAMYAYLLAARGRADDELVLGGVAALTEVFPTLDLRVEPGLSIQAAIDRAPNGATIHLEPGTYRERIVIDKDLTLVGALSSDAEIGHPSTVITGPAWGFVVSIEGDGVDVRLENLAISGGKVGVAVSGENSLHLEFVFVGSVNTAVSAYDGAFVSCNVCWFEGEGVAMIMRSGTTTRLADSTIQGGGVTLFSGSSLTMIDTSVSSCGGSGVYLQGDAMLHLERCAIYDNEGFGVFAYTAECIPYHSAYIDPEHDFSGTITGANNTIPGPDEEHGNLEGDICPEEYLFLKGGGPIIVPLGESE